MSGFQDPARHQRPPPKERRPGEMRNGAPPGPAPPGPPRAVPDDEKAKIIQSCFSKKDADGSVPESYITHIRVTEDAAYPSSPPPPKSPPENKKSRLIVVAVRKSGRVRLHKARENSDGSFSIGKTWLMDDLSRIQTFEHLSTSNPSEQQQKAWASNVGFVVTITKPYYWQAANPKERDYFIGSLVKIHKKYTGGKVPELLGFDPRDRDSLIGSGGMPPGAQPSRPHGPSPARPPNSAYSRSRSPSRQPQPQRGQSPYGQPPPSRDGPKEARRQPSREPFLGPQPSHDQTQLRPHLPAAKPSQSSSLSQDSFSKPSDSLTTSEPPRPPSSRTEQEQRSRLDPAVPDASTNRLPERPSDSRLNEERSFMKKPIKHDSPYQHEHTDVQGAGAIPPLEPAKSKPSFTNIKEQASTEKLHSVGNQNRDERNNKFAAPELTAEPQDSERPPPSRGSNRSFSGHTRNFDTPEPQASTFKSETTDRTIPSTDSKAEVPEPSKETDAKSATVESAQSPAPHEPTEEKEEDEHRPGLGPMVKNKPGKDLANVFKKAANAYSAFKPRPGGAAERLMSATKEKSGEGPDGITGVVPAPLARGMSNDSVKSPDGAAKDVPSSQPPPKQKIPKVNVSGVIAQSSQEKGAQTPGASEVPQRPPSPSGERRRQRREVNMTKYCNALGIDPSLLQGRGAAFDDVLTDLGWDGKPDKERRIEDLEADIRREIGRVQASSWLDHLELEEGKVDQLAKFIDKTTEECEELDGLLTLYSHELNTLADDVAYIEAQSQGLQVQAANQKLLQNELQGLLKTISISSADLRPLRDASLSNPEGIEETESTLSTLYKAMVTIDPEIQRNQKRLADSSSDRGGIGVYADTQVGQMRAVKERKDEYRVESQNFLRRLTQHMSLVFKMVEQKARDSAPKSRDTEASKFEPTVHETIRRELWMYNALLLFAREVNTENFLAIINSYEQQMRQSYQNDLREVQMNWKREARKPTGEENELLFTHQEKEKDSEGLTNAARKLTVRRGKAVRAPGSLSANASRTADGKIDPYVAFAEILEETTRLVSEEQNFVSRYFHLSSQETTDFSDLISSAPPDDRRCPDVDEIGPFEPDREVAKQLEQISENIFTSWPGDLQSIADWTVQSDPLQGIGALYAIEKKLGTYEETNQEYVVRGLHKVHSRLMTLFARFVDEQIRAIEDTKVKVKKRKGVIMFMRVFPGFSMSVENMLSIPTGEVFNVRFSVNDAYTKINRAMWDTLKFIAKEAPGQQATPSAGGGDPEDKEILNYHILLIENMNHYIEEVDVRDNIVLEEWKERAGRDMNEHMRFYMDSVIRRPLGKLLDFIESTESQLQAAAAPAEIAHRPSHSRVAAKKLFTSFDTKEIRRGIDALKKRVEKHFGDADDPALSRSLVAKVLKECEARYSSVHDRAQRILEEVYEGQVEQEWRKEEAISMFKR